MANALEYPGPDGSPDWDSLYLYRGSEVVEARPVFTGDVFFDAEVQGVGAIEHKSVLVIQHPCALRSNGVDLTDTLMVVEVVPGKLLTQSQWLGNYRVMPLPGLVGGAETEHYAGQFTSPYLAIPASLDRARRVACLSPLGVNLLLQRWVFHNSRAAVPTDLYDDATSAQYEEADGIEEWCLARKPKGIGIAKATIEATSWLNDDGGSGVKRREMLQNRQFRSGVRRAMRKSAREL
jgi:hypothetical protein